MSKKTFLRKVQEEKELQEGSGGEQVVKKPRRVVGPRKKKAPLQIWEEVARIFKLPKPSDPANKELLIQILRHYMSDTLVSIYPNSSKKDLEEMRTIIEDTIKEYKSRNIDLYETILGEKAEENSKEQEPVNLNETRPNANEDTLLRHLERLEAIRMLYKIATEK